MANVIFRLPENVKCTFKIGGIPVQRTIEYRHTPNSNDNGFYSTDPKLQAYHKHAQVACNEKSGTQYYALNDVEVIYSMQNGEEIYGSIGYKNIMVAKQYGVVVHGGQANDYAEAWAEWARLDLGNGNDMLRTVANNTILQGGTADDLYLLGFSCNSFKHTTIVDSGGINDVIVIPSHLSKERADFLPKKITIHNINDIQLSFDYLGQPNNGQNCNHRIDIYIQNWKANSYQIEYLAYDGDEYGFDLIKLVQLSIGSIADNSLVTSENSDCDSQINAETIISLPILSQESMVLLPQADILVEGLMRGHNFEGYHLSKILPIAQITEEYIDV